MSTQLMEGFLKNMHDVVEQQNQLTPLQKQRVKKYYELKYEYEKLNDRLEKEKGDKNQKKTLEYKLKDLLTKISVLKELIDQHKVAQPVSLNKSAIDDWLSILGV